MAKKNKSKFQAKQGSVFTHPIDRSHRLAVAYQRGAVEHNAAVDEARARGFTMDRDEKAPLYKVDVL